MVDTIFLFKLFFSLDVGHFVMTNAVVVCGANIDTVTLIDHVRSMWIFVTTEPVPYFHDTSKPGPTLGT
jgi:hypothetical protein